MDRSVRNQDSDLFLQTLAFACSLLLLRTGSIGQLGDLVRPRLLKPFYARAARLRRARGTNSRESGPAAVVEAKSLGQSRPGPNSLQHSRVWSLTVSVA